MTLEKIAHNGAWRAFDIVSNRFVSHVFYGYTKKEAAREFRAILKQAKLEG